MKPETSGFEFLWKIMTEFRLILVKRKIYDKNSV